MSTPDMDKIETIVTYQLDGVTFEVDHLGICNPSQWGQFAVYQDGEQVAEFALAESMLREDLRPAELPVTPAELVEMAQAAVAEPDGSPDLDRFEMALVDEQLRDLGRGQ